MTNTYSVFILWHIVPWQRYKGRMRVRDVRHLEHFVTIRRYKKRWWPYNVITELYSVITQHYAVRTHPYKVFLSEHSGYTAGYIEIFLIAYRLIPPLHATVTVLR